MCCSIGGLFGADVGRGFGFSGQHGDEHCADARWLFMDNGQVRLGVKKASSAGIGWFSASGSERNLINDLDRGRLIQKSYYGREGGSLWNQKLFGWNPFQDGVGAFVPVADQINYNHFADGQVEHGACSYFVPVVKFAVTPDEVFADDVFLTLHRSGEIHNLPANSLRPIKCQVMKPILLNALPLSNTQLK
jgi:hypothetical protein